MQPPPSRASSARPRLRSLSTRPSNCTRPARHVPHSLSTPPSDAARGAAFPHTPVRELPTPTPTAVSGSLPSWLSGTLFRNGPGAFPEPLRHMFDGFALVAAFDIDGAANTITHRQRYLETASWKSMRDTGKLAYAEFGTAAPPLATIKGLFAMLSGGSAFTDNASVTIRPSAPSELYASTEAPAGRVRVRASDLTTVGGPPVDGVKADLICAHTVRRSDGSRVGFGGAIGGGYTVYLEDRETCVRTPVATIPLRSGSISPCWMHAFPCTDAYAVLAEQPMPMALAGGALTASAPYYIFDFKPEWGTRYHVVPLPPVGGTGSPQQPPAPPFTIESQLPLFFFHVVNAWTEGNEFVFDVPSTDPAMVRVLSLANQRPGGKIDPVTRARLTRVRVPLDGGGTVSVAPVFDDSTSPTNEPYFWEFPTVARSAIGRRQRYVYGIGAAPPSPQGSALIKIDCDGNAAFKTWQAPETIVGEPLFIPRPDSTAEDDGVLLALCIGGNGGSFLVCVDAQTMAETARAALAADVPYGFHGAWVQQKG